MTEKQFAHHTVRIWRAIQRWNRTWEAVHEHDNKRNTKSFLAAGKHLTLAIQKLVDALPV